LAVYSVTAKTGRIKTAGEASPRIMIVTDSARVESVPASVRCAADLISTEDISLFQGKQPAGDANGFISWFEGDELLQGNGEDLRGEFLSGAPLSLLVPVHLNCLAEADFISLQPRLTNGGGAATETVSNSCRIRSSFNPSMLARSSWEKNPKPWARLHAALLCEKVPGAGIEPLKQVWQSPKLPPLFASLVLRNLALALLRKEQTEKAEELLTLGLKAYPGYSDLDYLSAVLWLYRQKATKAFAHLERALQTTESKYVGSGGENSYRSSWLLGTIYEEMGEEQRATTCFMPGVLRRPAFRFSVEAILRQRFSRFRAGQISNPLCELARREPKYLDAVFDFFLRHGLFAPPRRLLRTFPLPAEIREKLQARLALAETRVHRIPRTAPERPGVLFEGPFLTVSGHARINRAVGCFLLDSPILDAALEPSEPGCGAARLLPERARIIEGLSRRPARLDLTIRHFWPPDFRPPEAGFLASMLPWEHRAVPSAWVREIDRWVDELWAPSRFVAEAFIESGISRDRVQIIPHGFALEVFNPQVKPWRPPDCRGCVFLFVGGTIRRKGIDLLLRAYADTFSAGDDVTLVLKDTGGSSFYQHNNLLPEIRNLRRKPKAPHILLLTEELDDAKLASLYRGCDALALPYRGEGFGMPLLESMACGRPVVTTAAGPAPEFCASGASYLISAKEVPVADPPPPFGQFSREWTWFEPDLAELGNALREIYENRAEAERRGALAASLVLETHAWPRLMRSYAARIALLTGSSADAQIADATSTCSKR
jgi:glycosyltransferase involved in cell wall biosynthesis